MERTANTCAQRLGAVLGMALLPFVVWLTPRDAAAQSWVAGRTTPRLTEIVAIDATGEPGWPYGAEDVAGDGLETFQQQEQSIDIRTAYAATDMQRFWARIYVSDENAIGGSVTAYIFIDADRSTATGGTAAATEIDPRFTSDASQGGYDYVVGVRGNGTISQIWTWEEQPANAYVGAMPQPNEADAEAGQDLDPILISVMQHGYVQAMVDLQVVGLDATCDANLFVRSVNDNAAVGDGDLEAGQVAPCVPADANNDDIPDIVVPPNGCTSDAQCPAGGLCDENGDCILAVPCGSDADCQPDEQCSPDGRCLPRPTGMCSTNADCGDLICTGGQCGPCALGGAECGEGYRCAPNGHCVVGTGPGGAGGSDGLGLSPGEEVRGGACACRIGATSAPEQAAALVAAGGLILGLRRRRRSAGRSAAPAMSGASRPLP